MTKHTARHRIVLAGTSGALAEALPRHLVGHDLICLDDGDEGVLRRLPREEGDIRVSIRADITERSLGLPPTTYDDLASWATVIIHLPSVAESSSQDIERTSVEGARNLARFAEHADALLLHVSTAFVHAGSGVAGGATSFPAAAFKAEGAARAASSRWTIVRPSVVIGDCASGSVAGYQEDLGAPLPPVGRPVVAAVEPGWLLDVIPQDVAARALVALLDGRSVWETVWLTSGRRALTLEKVCAVWRHVAQTRPVLGATHHLSETAAHHRPIAPSTFAEIPPSAWAAITGRRQGVGADMLLPDALPTSVPELLGLRDEDLPDVASTYLQYLTQWVRECTPSAAAS